LQDLNIAADHCVEDNVDAEQRLTAVLKVVATLPAQCQRVVIMKKILGFSHQEIGRRLQISVRTVEKHLAKALQRCQESRPLDEAPTEAIPAAPAPRGKLLAMRGRRE
jgi:RNA polymerase sigma-70 factor (ECF subfamily)